MKWTQRASTRGGAGGYIFNNIYHVNPKLLVHTQGARICAVAHWIGLAR